MRTLPLNTDLNDLALGDPVSTGLKSLRERVAERLRYVRETWFLDHSTGVPYLGDIIGRVAGTDTPRQILVSQIESVPGVLRVRNVEYDFDNTTRVVSFSAQVVSEDGVADVAVGIPL